MSAEIPEVFRALLEHPFTLPNFEDDGKWLLNQTVCFVEVNMQQHSELRVFLVSELPAS